MARRDTEPRATIEEIELAEGVTATIVGGKSKAAALRLPKGRSSKETRPESKAAQDPFSPLYTSQGLDAIVEPPYPMDWLCRAAENNSILGSCIDSVSLNSVGMGWHLIPTVNIDHMEDGPDKDALKIEMDQEKATLEAFLDYCHPEESIESLAQKRSYDKGLTGCGYWEVTRFGNGELAGLEHVPSYTMRLSRMDKEVTTFRQWVKVSKTDYEERTFRKHFRRFLQITPDGRRTWFKEFGDPRILDSKTGRWITGTNEKGNPVWMSGFSPESCPEVDQRATEILYFHHYCTYSPYGVPKWIGNTLSVVGSRAYEEINADFADNKAVPPLAILVSGGKLKADSISRIENYVNTHIKGRGNFHSVLILETDAKSDPNLPGQLTRGAIELKPLTEAMQKDELFSAYDKRARDKIRGSFRLPPIYAGDTQDYTRATAEESGAVAEKQVFTPERLLDDQVINRKLLAAMRVRYWEFRSNSAVEDSAQDKADIYTKIRSEMTINEARKMIAEFMNADLPPLKPWWASQVPVSVILGLFQQDQANSLADLQAQKNEIAAHASTSMEGDTTPASVKDVKAPPPEREGNGVPRVRDMEEGRTDSATTGKSA